MARPRIFVSHSHDDNDFAERLVADLRAAGSDAWLDKIDLGAGDFTDRINAALEGCEWFMLVLTKSAIVSPWVKQEVHAANRLKHQGRIRDLIFVKAQPIAQQEVPAIWGVYNIFDASSSYSSAFEAMLRVLNLSPTRVSIPSSSLPQTHESIEKALQKLMAKGGALFNIFEYEDALQCYLQATQLEPTDEKAWFMYGCTLDELGRYEEALIAFDNLQVLAPNDADLGYLEASILYKLRRYDEVVQACDKTLALNPDHSDAWYFKGEALNELNRYEEALDALERAPQGSDSTWTAKAKSLGALGRVAEAMAAERHAKTLDEELRKRMQGK